MSSGNLSILVGVVCPGGVLVVEGLGLQAAVQDADQTVAELAQGGVMSGAAGAEPVVVRAGARRGPQRAEGLRGQGVGQPMVADVAGEDDRLLARGAGDRGLPGVVLP